MSRFVACEKGGYLQEWECPRRPRKRPRGRDHNPLEAVMATRVHLCGSAGVRRNCWDCNRIAAREAKRNQLPPDMRRWLIARDGNACVQCGATDDLQIDHIIPRSLGGLTDPDNLQTLCGHCNASKGDRVAE